MEKNFRPTSRDEGRRVDGRLHGGRESVPGNNTKTWKIAEDKRGGRKNMEKKVRGTDLT